ncbi:MAG TPA: DUF1573 domain-containing protein [Candidatus Binatia bacterium]|nr:DUF1573 domain-containing protein [Candidatus Binatia bacterium]
MLAMPAASGAAGVPRVAVPAGVHDFGSVEPGALVEEAFRLENTGSAPLRIENVKSSCGCTVGLASGHEVLPGGAGAVTVRLDTARLSGRVTKTVTVYTNDPAAPVVGLTLTGEVAADLIASPTPLYLGRIRHGTATRREIMVTSGRPGAAARVTWVENTNPALHATLEPLPAGGGQRVVVTLDPHIPLGRLNDQLTLHTTSDRAPELLVPVFGSVEGDVVVLPPQVTFGVTRAGDAPARELHIRNQGVQPLRITGVGVPKDVVRYELDTVEDGREYLVTLRLRDGLPPGTVEGAVDIFTDHPDEDHLVVPLYAIIRDGKRQG